MPQGKFAEANSPMIPQSIGQQTPVPNDSTPKSSAIKRRSVACKSCHSLKVKCTPLDPNNLSGPCVRCSKTGRHCEIDLSQPRRRKRKASPSVPAQDLKSPQNQQPVQQQQQTPQQQQQQQHQPQQQQPIQQTPQQQQQQQQHYNNDQSKSSSQVDHLERRIKFLEEELTKQHIQQQQQQHQQQLQQQQQQNMQNGSYIQHSNVQQPYMPTYSSTYSSPGMSHHSPANQSVQNSSNGYTYQQQQQQQQNSTIPKPSPTPSQFTTPHSYPPPPPPPHSTTNSLSQGPVSLPPIHNNNSSNNVYHSPYLQTPENIEISPHEINGDTDDQIQVLRTELELLMNTQKASLSELTTEVMKIADKRTDLINKKYGVTKFDCVDLGYITMEDAEERLRLYREIMYPAYPFIEIPGNMTADQMRKEYKFLFTTIITVTAVLTPKDSPSLENQVDIDLCNMRLITTEVMIIGNKTPELLKSLILLSAWYTSAELFHHRRYHLINSLCVSMVYDLGLTGRAYFFYNKEERSVRKTEVSENPKGLEYRRLLLTVYFTSISISLFLRRRIQVYWTAYLEECCEVMESTNDPGDLKISVLSKLNRMLERIHFIVHGTSEPTDSAFMQPDRLKYITSELQRDLSLIKAKIPRDDHCLISYYYSVQAYLHEPALQKLFSTQGPTSVSSLVISSIDKCSRSCIAALEELKLASLEELTVMPLLHSSRVIYTAGMLLRLRYLVISVPSLSKCTHFPRDSIERIQMLAINVYHSSVKYPANNFLHKMRLVIALFSQTYSTQLQKLISDKLHNMNSTPNVKWDKDGEIQSLHILSQAAELARTGDERSDIGDANNNNNNNNSNNSNNSNNNNNNNTTIKSSSSNNGNNGNVDHVTPPGGNATGGNTATTTTANTQFDNNADLEFSYYALNDEFWSDLLLNNDNDLPFGDLGARDGDQYPFDNEFI